ncbi:MAG: endonuclease [Pseudomonadota bacterium]
MSEPTQKYEDSLFCIIACWGVAALGGLAMAILFGSALGWGVIGGIFVGLIVLAVAGFLLSLFLCGRLVPVGRSTPLVYDENGVVDPYATARANIGPAPTAGVAAASAAAAAEPAPAPEPTPAPEPAPEPVPTAASAAPAATGAGVKPSKALAGQEDLSARKGEWKYEGEAKAEPAPAAKPKPAKAEGDYDGDGAVEGADEGTKPATLEAARDGKADDLKQIKGIGPKLEKLCNRLGFYHFDQIAAWTADEVAWVDANLEGFKGRVSRDEWVKQAGILAKGGETEFSKRVEGGDVY